jgi:hypothetical protein
LFDCLPPLGQETVNAFAKAFPLEAPLGMSAAAIAAKKLVPLPQTSPKTEGNSSARAATQDNSTRPKMEKPTDGTLEKTPGWKSEDLPLPLISYLGSQIHLLIAATTGSGKTWLLRCLCTELANRGHTLVIADPKGTRWANLTPAVLWMRSGMDYLSLFRDLEKELNKRIERLHKGEPVGQHLWVIFDEWTLLKGKCSSLDSDGKTAIEQRLLDLIAAGRELNMHLIMVNQSHLLGDLSLNSSKNTFSSGLRDNLCTISLGCKTTKDSEGKPMNGNSKAIDSMLDDRCLVRDRDDREAAKMHHAELRRSAEVNRTFSVYASRLFIGVMPQLEIPCLLRLEPFYKKESKLYGES